MADKIADDSFTLDFAQMPSLLGSDAVCFIAKRINAFARAVPER